MRIGLIGAGAIAHRHLLALEQEPEAAVVAVCDLDPTRAAEIARPAGAAVHTEWRSMLDAERLDAAFVCTPPEHHAEPVAEALGRGLAVYAEKPLARAVADGQAIVAAWRSSGGVCAVGYQWRSLDVLDRLRLELRESAPGMLLSHSIGATEAARDDLAKLGGGSWFTDPRRSGGILFELGSHSIDIQLAVAGRVTAVQAAAGRGLLALSGAKAGGLDDAVSVLLEFAGGGLGAVHVAWTRAAAQARHTLDVLAAEAELHLELDPEFRLTGLTRGGEVDVTSDDDPRHASVARFLAAARAGDPAMVACTPADALHTLEVAVAAEQAVASGRRVELPPA
ncbi:MAG: Gfo/Idh/MocA family protein [Gaiellales bacterium]